MFIVHVTPIAKTRAPDRLSYFSADDIPVGSIIDVPIQKRTVPALVLEVESARAIKALLRTNKYATRKIKPQTPRCILTPDFINAAQETADHFVTNTGIVIEGFVPKAILDGAPALPVCHVATDNGSKSAPEKQVLQLPRRERLDAYKTLVRSAFSKKQSVYLCVPTATEAHRLRDELKRGIDKYIFVFDSSHTKKRQITDWQAALEETHPVLIIATPSFVGIPRADIGVFIIERELAGSYKQMRQPFIDTRFLVESVAHHMHAQLVVADTFVRIQTHFELARGEAHELEERARRIRTQNTVELIDIGHVRKKWKESKLGDFPILSPQTLKLLKKGTSKKEKIFVYAARRGIAPHSVCNDCSKTVRCNHCNAPVVLHEQDNTRVLLCHRCGASRSAHETCAHCDSWNLVSLGVGIDRVYDAIQVHLPDTMLLQIDSDSTPKPKERNAVIEQFNAAKKGAVLVGTGMAVPYITDTIDQCIVSTLDSLMAIPDFRIEEKLFGLLMLLSEKTNNTMLIETSSPENNMLKDIHTGNVAHYTREELKVREQFKYPPYTVLIKVTREGTKKAVIDDMQKFIHVCRKYSPRVFSTLVKHSTSRFALSALIRVSRDTWPDSELVTLLRALPPHFVIDVEPERTL